MIDRLHRLAAVWGPAGREHKVAQALQEIIAPYVDEVRSDPFGNLLAAKRGTPGGARVMVSAHMDTIGAIALNVSDAGLIHVGPVGGFKVQHAIGQRVVWGSGVVGVLQHQPVEGPKDLDFGKLWCDIGATSREEALENVRLGDMCVMVGELQQMGDYLTGPGLGNRAGCAVLLQVAEHLVHRQHEVVFAFTCQGEVGPRGSGAAAYGINPDLALIVDMAPAGDIPKGPKVEVKLGRGPALKLKDGNYMAHAGLADQVRRVASDFAISLQTEISVQPGGLTDAQVIGMAGQGVPTAAIDVPVRYRGTGAEMISTADLHGAADLLLKLLSGPLGL